MEDVDEISTEYGLIVDKIDNLSWSFHSNKKVVFFKAVKDGSNYRYRMGIQLTPAASDKNHTLCIEQFFTNETYWDKSEITITGTGISLPYYHNTKFHYNIGSTEYYYTKTIVQLKKVTAPSHYLYYTTHIDNVSSSSPNELQLYAVIYGIDSYLYDIDSSVYNLTPFIIVNDNIQMQYDVDTNNGNIKNANSIECKLLKNNKLNKTFNIDSHSQTGNTSTLFFPGLGGQNRTIATQDFVNKRNIKIRGFIKKGESDVIFGNNKYIFFLN